MARYRRYRRRSSSETRALVVIAALGAALASGSARTATAQHSPPPQATLTTATSGGTLDCAGLEQLWIQAGGSPSAATLAASVAMAESGGQQSPPSNAGSNYNGMTDVGYWQINSGIFPSLATTDPIGNARAAIQISHDGTDFSPWVTYQTGTYQGKC